MLTEYVPTEERVGPRFPLLLTTGRILSQYNVGAQTRRTANIAWHDEDVLEIHPFDAEQRGVVDGDLVALQSRSGEIALARPGQRTHAAGRRLYDLPPRGHRRQCGDHREFRLGDQLPGIQGDRGAGPAHQPSFGLAGPRPGGRRSACVASPERVPMPPNEGAASIEVEARSFSYDSGAVEPAFAACGRRRGAGRDRHRRRALRRDDGDAVRPRGFRLRVSADRGNRRTSRRHSRHRDRGGDRGLAGQGDAHRREAQGASRAQTRHRRAHRLRPVRRRGSFPIALDPGARSTAGPPVEPAAIGSALAELEKRQPLNALTRAVHAAAWCARDGRIVLVREDVGRHNALDKAIGALVTRPGRRRQRILRHHQPLLVRDGREGGDFRRGRARVGLRADVACADARARLRRFADRRRPHRQGAELRRRRDTMRSGGLAA